MEILCKINLEIRDFLPIFAVRKTIRDMKKQDTFTMLTTLFNDLSESAKVEIMTMFYYQLDDYHKDEFLRETDNA